MNDPNLIMEALRRIEEAIKYCSMGQGILIMGIGIVIIGIFIKGK